MARRLYISGTVQGVGYRAAFARQAQALRLRGWVRNRRDGRVEALVEGGEPALAAIEAWARKGPPAALVSAVEARDEADESADGFRLLPDA
jgi:acylphosphatase